MNPPPFADLGAAPAESAAGSLSPEERAEMMKLAEEAWNDEEGIARWAAWFEQQPPEFREMIDELGTASRGRVAP
ncbi:MAG: hypothetical protein U0359_10870 [Byssovorax sp.]